MLSTSVPIRREASQGETTTGAADIEGEVVPPQMGPPEHLHARSDAGFLVVKRRHTGKDDRGLALVDDRSTAWHRELAHLKSVFCTQAKNICHTKKQVHEHGLTSLHLTLPACQLVCGVAWHKEHYLSQAARAFLQEKLEESAHRAQEAL